MLCVVLRPCDDVVETNQHDVNEIVEAVCHGTLEGSSSIFEAKGHDSVCECASWGCERHLVTVFFLDLDLVVSEKTINEGKGFMFGTCIDDLVNERCGEVVFGTCTIKIAKVYANANGTLFFIHGTGLETQVVYVNG